MERSSSFTATPGWGQVVMGLTAVAVAAVAARQTAPTAWLAVWLTEAFLAIAVAVPTMYFKVRRAGFALTSGPGRRVALTFLPSALAAMIVTAAVSVCTRANLKKLAPHLQQVL